jgi:hypothetical protein
VNAPESGPFAILSREVSVAEEQSRSGEIKVSSKTLALISAGIYRSPAGALKELVSNAFDADAAWVRVSMNAPSFDVVSIADNGSGITYGKFVRLMEQQIGESDKRTQGEYTLRKHRPLIGRIGIGLLAIAQISHEFEVVSHHSETREAFRARVRLINYIQDKLEEDEKQLSRTDDHPDHDIGTYDIVRIPYDQGSAGTQLIATRLKRGFMSRLRRDKSRLPRKFAQFYDSVVAQDSLVTLGEYRRLTWGLAVSCPLPYYDGGPVRQVKILDDRQQELKNYGFTVFVDHLQLERPVVLPPREAEERPLRDVRVTNIGVDKDVDGSLLKGRGYIYSQGGKSIYPAELRGMLIRIKGVAIGEYDKSFLEYPIQEGPRFGWLSGELDIQEGLEDALNIDRDSFNETHPHFMEIQTLVHGYMDEEVRPWLYRNLDVRAKARTEESNVKREERLLQVAKPSNPEIKSVVRVRENTGDPRRSNFVPPLRLEPEAKRVVVNDAAPWPRARRNREIAELVSAAFETALKERDLEGIRRRFYQLLARIF